MRKLLFTLSIMFVLLSSMANTPLTSMAKMPENLLLEESQNQLVIEIQSNTGDQRLEYLFNTAEELLNFDLDTLFESIAVAKSLDDLCTVSITVTVRLGIDSNFVEASATASGIACGEVVKAIKALRAQILAGIK